MQLSFIQSIHQVDPAQWNGLWNSDYPFLRHAFLAALENSGSTRAEAGWQPYHGLIKDEGRLVGVMPLFLKSHSYGEYVFDWAWADAYAQHQVDYYPKLINAVPFTPATGPRLALAATLSRQQQTAALEALRKGLGNLLDTGAVSGWHSLFPYADNRAQLRSLPGVLRYGYQFHWFNRDYREFDDFLGEFSSRKRKDLKKERRRVREAGLTLLTRTGREIGESEWRSFHRLYQHTYLKRSGHYGYLGSGFFPQLAATMPDQVVLVSAHGDAGEMVAAAFYLRDAQTLYGRYWGAREEHDGLHFEACYYRGIEYAIAEGLQRFDPGAQGEHKIQRGFVPIITCSQHWLADARFAEAIEDFCNREALYVKDYVLDARRHLPFRDEVALPPDDILLTPHGHGQ